MAAYAVLACAIGNAAIHVAGPILAARCCIAFG
jgi:hypothetical protein